jgi:hypothetical protein
VPPLPDKADEKTQPQLALERRDCIAPPQIANPSQHCDQRFAIEISRHAKNLWDAREIESGLLRCFGIQTGLSE